MSAALYCTKCQSPLAASATQCALCGTPSPIDPFIGVVLNQQYHIKYRLGFGGFGAVYEAEEPRVGRSVAVKILHPELTRDPTLVERFRREAIAASKLEHPAAVKILNFAEAESGVVFLVMELLSGETLADHLKKNGPFAPKELSQFLKPVCEALFEAHQKRIIHRDLKPQNFMLLSGWREGHVKILDFGIAKMLDTQTLTRASSVMGTPAYMAPELWDDSKIFDGRADLYALGVVLYQMLSGKLPLEATHLSAWVKKHCLEAPLPLSKATNAALPEGIDRAVMKALEKEPDARYPDALAMLREFEAALHPTQTPSTKPTPKPKRYLPWLIVGPVIIGASALFFLSPSQAPNKPSKKPTRPNLQWLHPSTTGEDLTSIVQTKTRDVIIFGDFGTMLRSSEQESWQELTKVTTEDILSACSTSTQIIAVGEHGLLLQSKDDGSTWSNRSISTNDLSSLYCLSDAKLFAGDTSGKILESDDGGGTWSETQIAPIDATISSIWATAERVFASATQAEKGTLFCKADSTWAVCKESEEEMSGLFLQDGILYLSSLGTVEKSMDLGKTWVSAPIRGQLRQITSWNGSLYAAGLGGIFQEDSHDPLTFSVSYPGYSFRALLPAEASLLSVGDGGQLLSQQDEEHASHAFTEPVLALLATELGVFVATGGDTLRYSSDNGGSWKSVTLQGLPKYNEYDRPFGLSFLFEAKGNVYASTLDGHVARWLPEDKELHPIGEGASPFGLLGVSDGLYDKENKILYFTGNNGVLYYLRDSSHEWGTAELIPESEISGLHAIHKAGKNIFVVAEHRLYTFTNDPTKPTEIKSPLFAKCELSSLEVDSKGSLYVGARSIEGTKVRGHVLRSQDQGKSWEKVLTTNQPPQLQVIGERLYALDQEQLWATKNGSSWEPITLPSSAKFYALKKTVNNELLLGGDYGRVAIFLPP